MEGKDTDFYRMVLKLKKAREMNNSKCKPSSMNTDGNVKGPECAEFLSTWDDEIFQPHLSDFELHANDGGIVRAHKAILAGKSKVFKTMITSGMSESTEGRVQISDMNVHELRAFVEFLYKGRVNTRGLEIHAVALYKASVKYDLPYLTNICVSFLITNVHRDIPGVLSLVSLYDVESLEEPLLPLVFSDGFVDSNDPSYVLWAFRVAFSFDCFKDYKGSNVWNLLHILEKAMKNLAGQLAAEKGKEAFGEKAGVSSVNRNWLDL